MDSTDALEKCKFYFRHRNQCDAYKYNNYFFFIPI